MDTAASSAQNKYIHICRELVRTASIKTSAQQSDLKVKAGFPSSLTGRFVARYESEFRYWLNIIVAVFLLPFSHGSLFRLLFFRESQMLEKCGYFVQKSRVYSLERIKPETWTQIHKKHKKHPPTHTAGTQGPLTAPGQHSQCAHRLDLGFQDSTFPSPELS